LRYRPRRNIDIVIKPDSKRFLETVRSLISGKNRLLQELMRCEAHSAARSPLVSHMLRENTRPKGTKMRRQALYADSGRMKSLRSGDQIFLWLVLRLREYALPFVLKQAFPRKKRHSIPGMWEKFGNRSDNRKLDKPERFERHYSGHKVLQLRLCFDNCFEIFHRPKIEL